MGKQTGIQWTNSTMNPWRGCTKISPGCTHCYAETLSNRNPSVLGTWGPKGTRVLASAAKWREPLGWNAGTTMDTSHRVFCASLADVLEDWPGTMTDAQGRELFVSRAGMPVTDEDCDTGPIRAPYTMDCARARLWTLVRKTPRLTWQLLTKRPENVARMMPEGDWPNVWMGVSVETQEYAWRCDALSEVPQKFALRWVSAEPLLGPLDLGTILGRDGIGWLVVGGESGSDRPCELRWVRGLIEQCRYAEVACFVKQLGATPEEVTVGNRRALRLVHHKGGDIREFPPELQVRQFPE
jgi:protein gp37